MLVAGPFSSQTPRESANPGRHWVVKQGNRLKGVVDFFCCERHDTRQQQC
jgi:hypothetical protein